MLLLTVTIFGIHWLGFIILYFAIGILPATAMTPTWKSHKIDSNFGIDFDYDITVLLVLWLFWPIAIAFNILKFVFYNLPKDIIYTIKWLYNYNKNN